MDDVGGVVECCWAVWSEVLVAGGVKGGVNAPQCVVIDDAGYMVRGRR